MKYLTLFFRFWYDFLIGDSWQIALGVVLVLALMWGAVQTLPAIGPVAELPFFLGLLAVFCGVLTREPKKNS